MKKLFSVTIGVPAFNEEKEIKQFVLSLLEQQADQFVISKIIVVSDGSTDNTARLVQSINDKKIELIIGKKRVGKPSRINQIFKAADTDCVVIFDADLSLNGNNVVKNLIEPIMTSTQIQLTSGLAEPLKPKNWVQRVIFTGLLIWKDVKKNSKFAEMYFCEGQVRGFSRQLYKELIFPAVSADDIYPYLYCKKYNYGFKYCPKALVYFQPPRTFSDYVKQTKRFLKSEKIQSFNFDESFVKENFVIGFKEKAPVLLKFMLKDPLFTMLYLLFLIVPKILVQFEGYEPDAVWEIISSTKKLHG